MSGTVASVKRRIKRLEEQRDNAMAMNSNRSSLLQITIAELISLYGEENVNIGHPLFTAIQSSANGALIDLEKLSADIIEFNTEEVPSV